MLDNIKKLFTKKTKSHAESLEHSGDMDQQIDEVTRSVKDLFRWLVLVMIMLFGLAALLGTSGTSSMIVYEVFTNLNHWIFAPTYAGWQIPIFIALALWVRRFWITVRYVDYRSGNIRNMYCFGYANMGDHYVVRTWSGAEWQIEADTCDTDGRIIHVHGKACLDKIRGKRFALDVVTNDNSSYELTLRRLREKNITLQKEITEHTLSKRKLIHSLSGANRGGKDEA